MKLSFQAIKRFVDFSGSVEDCANALADLGFPNDGIEKKGAALQSVIVGRIDSKAQHPQADRLSLLKVNVGTQILSVVCGAKNMDVGDHVALAPIGATIPGKDGKGMTMERAKIRGEESEGMCCSLVELALGAESDGIWILDPKKVGQSLGKPVAELLPELSDAIILVDVTPNRGDALCVRGLARELAAKFGLKLKPQKLGRWKTPGANVKPSVENFDETFGFLACKVEGLKVQSSPADWVQFLESSGARSINNLVDATNMVLFEYGHPIHFFDAEKVDANSIQARFAKEGESLKLLDGQTIELHPEDLVIADQNQVLSLAGIMGGAASSVSEATTSVVIEVASFNPKRVRASAKRHQLSSESSQRFERGVNAHRLEDTLERALGLLQDAGGFETASGSKVLTRQLPKLSCLWDRKKVEAKIGRLEWSDNQIFDRLRALEYEFDPRGAQPQVSFPWYRTDAERLEDVMEDVARLIGYENLEKTSWVAEESVRVIEDLRSSLQVGNELLDRWVSLGFCQSIHWSFTRPEVEKDLGIEETPVTLENPIHAEKSVLRQSLLPQLLECAKLNAAHGEEDIRLVEIGPVFRESNEKNSGHSDYLDSPKVEEWKVAVVWYPRAADEKRIWDSKEDPVFRFKGWCEAAMEAVVGKPLRISEKLFHPKRHWSGAGGGGGEIHPRVMLRLDMAGRAFGAEWTLKLKVKSWKFSAPSEFPGVDLDLCLALAPGLSLSEVEKAIQKQKSNLLESSRAYDVFEDAKILGAGKKAITFAMRYRDPKRTLSLEEVKKEHERILQAVLQGLGSERVSLR